MVGRDIGCRLLVGLASLSLLAACAAGVSPTPLPASPTPTSMPTAVVATPTPTPAPTQGAVSYGPVSVFTGSETCDIGEGATTNDADGTRHARGGSIACTDTANDPRMSGTVTGTWEYDAWGVMSGRIPGALVQWGAVRLVNDGGAWEGRLTGTYSVDRGDIIAIWYTGTGGYTGLAAFELATGREPWTTQGQVFPGNPPTPTGALNRVTVSHPVYAIAATEHAVWAVHNLESADPTALPPPGVVTRIAY